MEHLCVFLCAHPLLEHLNTEHWKPLTCHRIWIYIPPFIQSIKPVIRQGCFQAPAVETSATPPFLKHLMSIEELLLFRGLLEGCSEVRESPMLSARKYFLRCYFKERILKGQFTKPGKVMDKVLKCLHVLQLGVLRMGPQRKEPFISTKTYCNLHR